MRFPQGVGSLSTTTLPTSFDPLIPDDLEYQGSAADPTEFTQNVQYDDDENVLFFIVDGNIYNHAGLLIADNNDDPATCRNCLWKGTNRIAIIPVPGYCLRYYIVAGEDRADRTDEDAHLVFGVLDLTLSNDAPEYASYPGSCLPVMGRLATYGDDAFDLQIAPAIGPMALVEVPGDGDPCLWVYTLPNTNTTGYDAARFDVIEIDPDRRLLVIDAVQALNFLLFRNDGPHAIAGQNKPIVLEETHRSIRGEVEATLQGTTLKVACSHFKGAEDTPLNEHLLGVLHWKFDATDLLSGTLVLPLIGATPDLYPVDAYNGTGPLDYAGEPIEYPRVCGLEFSPSGEYVYFIKSSYTPLFDYNMGYIDTDLLPGAPGSVNELDIGTNLDSRKLADSELDINIGPNGTGHALYAITAEPGPNYHLAMLTDPDAPNPSNWDPSILPLSDIAVRTDIGDIELRVLDSRVAECTQLAFLQDGVNECCEELALVKDMSRTIPAGPPDIWYLGDNPFGNTSDPVQINCELRFATGSTIVMHDMVFHFGPEARMTIEPGAKVTMIGCRATGSCERRWKGIRIEGTTGDPLQQIASQGRLYLLNSEVSNAEVGVWCATITGTGVELPSGYGGRIHATNSILRNNIVGAKIHRYHRVLPGPIPVPNLSFFQNCDFITDAEWPDLGVNVPNMHADLFLVDGVRFTNCSFRNDAFDLWPITQWGWGLKAHRATFNCTGNSDFANNRFANLTLGAQARINSPGFTNHMDGMGFHNNWYGMTDWVDQNAVITNNQFSTCETHLVPNSESSTGLLILQSNLYTVERNTFAKPTPALSPGVGIWFWGPALQDNRVYDNEYTDLNVSCVVEGKHGAGVLWDFGLPPTPGLQLLCGVHNETGADHLLLYGWAPWNKSTIANLQGALGFPQGAANNQFNTARVCPGPSWDIFAVWTLPSTYLDISYVYYNHFANPEMRPRCIHTTGLVPESFMDDFYDLIASTWPDPFSKELHCSEGELDQVVVDVITLKSQYIAKLAELASAVNTYAGEVDGGDPNELLDLIKKNDPWLASHYLRELLLTNSPLSDEAMILAIQREQPMDPWHLTQVLLGNSPLSNQVWAVLNESNVLNDYFLTLLRDYEGGMSTRQLLEQEVALRSSEKARLQHRLMVAYSNDSTTTGRLDSMVALMELDTFAVSVLDRHALALERGDYVHAAELADVFDGYEEMLTLVEIGTLHESLNGDFRDATPAQRDQIRDLAFRDQLHGSMYAWAVLLELDETDSLPPTLLPEEYRYLPAPDRYGPGNGAALLDAHPNPASDRVMIAYPPGVESGVLEFFDAQGRTLQVERLMGRKAFIEVDTRAWNDGLYVARLLLDGISMGEVKFNVVH